MAEALFSSDTSLFFIAGIGLAAAATLATAAFTGSGGGGGSSANHETADGKPLRKIHTMTDSYPVVGDLFGYLQNAERFHEWMAETCQQFNYEPWMLRIPGQSPTLVVSTPEAFEDVLVTQFDNFPRGAYISEVLEGIFGQSIATFDGQQWHHQRKTASKFFTGRALRLCMMKTMRKNVKQLNDVIDASIDRREPLDLSNLLSQFTLQTFAEVGLGVDLKWIGKDELHPLHGAAEVASPAVTRRFRMPRVWWKLEKYLSIGQEGQLARYNHKLNKWFSTLIDQSIEASATRQRQRQELQAQGIKLDDDHELNVKSVVELFFESSSDDHDVLSSEYLVDFVKTFVLAAQDTSALTLTRMFLVLTSHPQVEKRLREEITAVLEQLDATDEEYLTMDHVNHLVYLEATIKETLRLYPAVPAFQKEAAADTVVCGDVPVTKGDAVCAHTYTMARNPNVWGPDAAEFKPARWIDETNGQLKTEPLTKFASFGAGPRVCIGMKLGMLELRIVAANLLRRYSFALAAPNDGAHSVGITLPLKHPLIVTATRVA